MGPKFRIPLFVARDVRNHLPGKLFLPHYGVYYANDNSEFKSERFITLLRASNLFFESLSAKSPVPRILNGKRSKIYCALFSYEVLMVTHADPRSLQHLSLLAARKAFGGSKLKAMIPEVLADFYQNNNPIRFADMYAGSKFEEENLKRLY